MTTIYCANWVLPVVSAPIDNGAVAVEGPTIVSLGARDDVLAAYPEARRHELGESAIVPGFINTHSHLELTAMRGYLEREEGDFFRWLKKLTIARLERMTADDLEVSATWGAIEAARAGVTTLGDASSAASASIKALTNVGLRGTVYQESFGPDPKDAKQNVRILRDDVAQLCELETPLVRVGVSPHAPYSVSAPQLDLIAEFALEKKLPVMMHAAESRSEWMLMSDGTGPFAEGLAGRGIDWRAPGISTIQYLARHGILSTRPLLAHCIAVNDEDIETMKAAGAGVAHCPKSNAKLGHGRAPLAAFLQNEVDVGFGSDSVASNNTCDILEEARFATLTSRAEGDGGGGNLLSADDALRTATTGGARALGYGSGVGALAEGGQADIAVVSIAGAHQLPNHDAVATLIFASSGRDVVMTIVAGREVYRDGRVVTVDEERLRERMREIGKRVSSAGCRVPDVR